MPVPPTEYATILKVLTGGRLSQATIADYISLLLDGSNASAKFYLITDNTLSRIVSTLSPVHQQRIQAKMQLTKMLLENTPPNGSEEMCFGDCLI